MTRILNGSLLSLLNQTSTYASTVSTSMIRFFTPLAIVFALVQVHESAAQSQPPKHRITPQLASGAEDVHSADVNGDGLPDVISASRRDNKIAWHENTGGSFSQQRVISTDATNARSVFTSDLDGDGDEDVLSASSSDDKIAWYENDGTGSFSSQKVITTSADGATSVYAADLDGDGDSDVLSASSRDDKIAWYENLGDGSFTSQKTITTNAGSAQSVYAADLNNDGDLDVLSASADDKIAWYENTDGDGTFSSQNIITSNADQAQSVYADDLNGDGNVDVLSASGQDNKIAWYENDGTGSFSGQNVISTNANIAVSVSTADLDGDGDPDVLSASQGDNKIAAYDNQIGESGADSDGFGGELTVSTTAEGAQSVCAEDLDGDGYPDVLSASSSDNKIAWYKNDINTGGGFSSQRVIAPFGLVEEPLSSYAADLDGDGDKDALSASRVDNKVAWYENNGSGSFSGQKVITTSVDGAESVYATDLNGDGRIDVLSASSGDDKIAWYENMGSGSFSSQKVITTNAQTAQEVYAADLDGDGDKDVLSASVGDDKIALYENDGSGSFSAQKVITTSANSARSVYAADVDGDGDKDVLSASYQDDKIAWYKNDGSASFSSQKVITNQSAGAISVHAADLDGDGDMDVISASEGGFDSQSKVSWHESSSSFGSITFSTTTISTNVQAAVDVHASDLNGDNVPDVLSASGLDDKVAWYENSGGSFSSQKIITSSFDGSVSVYAADLDGDDDKDVLSAAFDGNEVAWFENTSSTLPVELASFEARRQREGSFKLIWQTASETNNARFDVQRLQQKEDWTTIGQVEGAGTTTEAQRYSYEVSDLPYGTHRFRLRQVDLDGTVHTSKEVEAVVKPSEGLSVQAYPNPVSTTATVKVATGQPQDVTVEIYDLLGRQVAQLHEGTVAPERPETLTLESSNLSSGTYFLRARGQSETKTKRITIVR